LETGPGGYALVAKPEQVDAQRFEAAVRAFPELNSLSSQTELLHALDQVARALDLGRGDALEDVAGMAFAHGELARLEQVLDGR